MVHEPWIVTCSTLFFPAVIVPDVDVGISLSRWIRSKPRRWKSGFDVYVLRKKLQCQYFAVTSEGNLYLVILLL